MLGGGGESGPNYRIWAAFFFFYSIPVFYFSKKENVKFCIVYVVTCKLILNMQQIKKTIDWTVSIFSATYETEYLIRCVIQVIGWINFVMFE